MQFIRRHSGILFRTNSSKWLEPVIVLYWNNRETNREINREINKDINREINRGINREK